MRELDFVKELRENLPKRITNESKKLTIDIETDEETFERMKLKAFLEVETIGDYIGRLVYEDTKEIKRPKELNQILNNKEENSKEIENER